MGGTLQEERERSGGLSPGPLGLGSSLSSQAGSPTSKAPGRMSPGGIGGRPGRSGEAGGKGPAGGAGEEQRATAPSTQAPGAC